MAGGEGTGLGWERFDKVLVLVVWLSLAGDKALVDLAESWSLADEEVFGWSVRDGVVDTAPASLAAPRPLRPRRSLSGTSLGVAGSGSGSGDAPRSRPLVLVEVVKTLSLSLGLRPRRAGAG